MIVMNMMMDGWTDGWVRLRSDVKDHLTNHIAVSYCLKCSFECFYKDMVGQTVYFLKVKQSDMAGLIRYYDSSSFKHVYTLVYISKCIIKHN